MSDRFDFEQQIVRCWSVVDELKDLDEGLFEDWLKFDKDSVSHHILGIAECYDLKFHKLWHLFETVYMDTVRENKMLNEECAALREQLQQSDPDTAGYGIVAIKPKKKDKK
jgi:hypothetical protein